MIIMKVLRGGSGSDVESGAACSSADRRKPHATDSAKGTQLQTTVVVNTRTTTLLHMRSELGPQLHFPVARGRRHIKW